MKKAFRWLKAQDINYTFHDYKKVGIGADRLTEWCEKTGWKILLNKRGLTWRGLPDADKQDVGEGKAISLMVRNPSLIKRPVLEHNGRIEVGFEPERYASVFDLHHF